MNAPHAPLLQMKARFTYEKITPSPLRYKIVSFVFLLLYRYIYNTSAAKTAATTRLKPAFLMLEAELGMLSVGALVSAA